MRLLFLLIMIAGSLLRFGYPLYISNFSGEKQPEQVFFQRGTPWTVVKTRLEQDNFPVGVKVRLLVDAPSDRLSYSGGFVLKVRGPGNLSFSDILDFELKPVGDGDVNGAEQELWQTATTLQFIQNGPYFFALAPLANNPLSVRFAFLQLTTNVGTYDARLLLAGAAMMAVGGIGFVWMSLRARRQNRDNGNSTKSRWGRRRRD